MCALDDLTLERLALRRPVDLVVSCIVAPGDPVDESTMHLLAPVVLNRTTGAAAQVVLAHCAYASHAPIG